MRRTALALGLFACAALALAALPVSSQATSVPVVLAGTFEYPHDLAHAQRVVEAAVEPRVQALPEMFRGIARERVRERVRVARRITIGVGPRTRVTYEGERTTIVDTAVPGSTTVTDPEGREVPVEQRIRAGWLEQVFAGPNGELRMLLSCEPDGATLHVDVTLASERLGEPVRYRLDYARR